MAPPGQCAARAPDRAPFRLGVWGAQEGGQGPCSPVRGPGAPQPTTLGKPVHPHSVARGPAASRRVLANFWQLRGSVFAPKIWTAVNVCVKEAFPLLMCV